jgi:pyruvate dehydrogenase E1 component beta subunit
VATDIAALVATKGLEYLDAPVKMVTGAHTPVPFSPTLENAFLPSTERIVAAIREIA